MPNPLTQQAKVILNDLGIALRSIYEIESLPKDTGIDALLEQLNQIPSRPSRLVSLDVSNQRMLRILGKECNATLH